VDRFPLRSTIPQRVMALLLQHQGQPADLRQDSPTLRTLDDG
jgi:hypothetical protein